MTDPNEIPCPRCDERIPKDAPGGLCPRCALEGAASIPTVPTGGRAAQPPTVDELAPHFPDLEIIELLGVGGMGAVYKARQPQLDRFVALKILSHDLAADPAFEERFNREAKVLARLSHANIVAIFDFGTAGPHCYLLMEYVDGVNLRQAMQAGRFTPAESLTMVEDICAALKFAHEEGILHRDIKPENVLIDSRGRVKIADFGIAKLVGEQAQPDVTLTMQGSVLGSPHYMAPEQFESPGDVDQRADIYSVGVVFYELLTGELPIGRFALPSEKAAMDARIDEIVLRTLEKERQARFQSAEEVMTQVGAVAEGPIPPAPPAMSKVGDDAGGARGSLSSAILTGVSLVILIATALLTAGSIFSYKATKVVGAIGLSLSAIVAIVGIILGCVALAAIRRSGGQKSGLGLAVFGVVSWPVLMMPMFGSLFMMMPMPSSGGGYSVGPWVLLLFLVVPAIIAAFVLVRTLRRWAGGVPREDGVRDFPGMGRGLALVVFLALAGPVLLVTIPRFLPEPEGGMFGAEREADRRRMEAERAMEQALRDYERMSSSGLESPSENTVDPMSDLEAVRWRTGDPEFQLPMTLESGHEARLRIFLQHGNGDTSHVAGLGNWTVSPEYDRENKVVSIGTELIDTNQRAVIVMSGKNSGIIRTLEDLRDYEFSDALPETLTLDSPGLHKLEIAHLRKSGQATPTKVLVLEVVVSE